MSKQTKSKRSAASNSGQLSAQNVRSARNDAMFNRSSMKAAKPAAVRRPPLDRADPMGMGGSPLSPCAQEYAASLANPFADGPDGACIPDAPALMTRRSKVFARGTFSSSSAAGGLGEGFIVIDPLSAIASDRPCVFINNPTQPTPGIDLSTASTFTSNSEYVAADVSSTGIQTRVVSAGVRIRNVTAILNKGGFVIGLHEPAHVCMDTFTIGGVDLYLESGRFSGDTVDKWTSLVYRPVDTDDLDFVSAFPTVTPPPAGSANAAYMGFIVKSPDTTGANNQLYEFEAFFNFETQGIKAIGKEPSHADPNGYAAVNAMTVFARNLHSPHQEDSQKLSTAFVKGSEHYVTHHMSQTHGPREGKKESSIWADIVGAIPKVVQFAAPILASLL